MDYSASLAEIGRDAGIYTWRAACEDSPDYMILDTDEKRQLFRDHVKGFGAWDDKQIAGWNDTELNALLIQLISGDIRESNLTPDSSNADWEEYYERAERDEISGSLSRDADAPTRVYYIWG